VKASPIGRRYGRALLELAAEKNVIPKIRKDLEGLVETWNGSEELQSTFENPAISAEARRKIVDAIGKRMMLSTETINTLKLLADRRRFRHLPEIAEAYIELAEAREGRVVAEVTSAAPLAGDFKMKLQKELEAAIGKKVVVVEKQDPELIAGVVTRVGDKVFDGSVRHRLRQIEEELAAR